MKNLLKNKKLIIILSSVLAVLLIAGTVFCFTRPKNTSEPVSSEPESSEITSDVVIDEPEDNNSTEESNNPQEIEDDGNALTPDESTETPANKNTGNVADANNTVVTEATEPKAETENENNGGISIGGNTPVEEAYDCGCANHHCQNEEFHASLINRELEGCPFCGSHSCPSFYAVNEWGYTKYDATLCPQYNAQKDDALVCPDCGRPMWSPDNPTGCFRYLQDTQCECGELVPGNTCHHH
jgi:hypothetical protein